jgi:hypothetical protein
MSSYNLWLGIKIGASVGIFTLDLRYCSVRWGCNGYIHGIGSCSAMTSYQNSSQHCSFEVRLHGEKIKV